MWTNIILNTTTFHPPLSWQNQLGSSAPQINVFWIRLLFGIETVLSGFSFGFVRVDDTAALHGILNSFTLILISFLFFAVVASPTSAKEAGSAPLRLWLPKKKKVFLFCSFFCRAGTGASGIFGFHVFSLAEAKHWNLSLAWCAAHRAQVIVANPATELDSVLL